MTPRPLIALALIACSPASLPPPRIVAVDPPRMLANDALTVHVQLDAVLPFAVDFGQTRASADPRVSLVIGNRPLPASDIDADGGVSTFVPSVFTPAAYTVTVRLADGRAAVAPDGFTVDPGQWPDSYEFVPPIADQVVGQAFAVTVRAVLLDGGTDTAFTGTASLSANRVSGGSLMVTPETTAHFEAGLMAQGLVTIQNLAPNGATLTVTDLGGRTGTSNTFKVAP